MRFRDIFTVTRGTKVILIITLSVAFTAALFAYFYYSTINRSEDPRVLEARILLNEYDKITSFQNPSVVFRKLDSAMVIFRSFPDYKQSFETGVIYNNKCSSLLMKALYDTTLGKNEKETLLNLALEYCDSGIYIYKGWITEWGSLTRDEISDKLHSYMKSEDPFLSHNFERIFSRRIRNIMMAQTETPRRLSVSLTNKGTILRHMMKPDSARVMYSEALSLWKENRTAKSNMSVLSGGEPLKPSVIESLFPPDKNRK